MIFLYFFAYDRNLGNVVYPNVDMVGSPVHLWVRKKDWYTCLYIDEYYNVITVNKRFFERLNRLKGSMVKTLHLDGLYHLKKYCFAVFKQMS